MAADTRTMLSLAKARQKCKEKHSCFSQIKCIEHMCLPPTYIGQLRQGINDELGKKLMKFCDKLEAVVVAYDKIELLQRNGDLVDETPFLHFDVRVNYIIFKPQVDSKLIGVVNKFGCDHVGCLVHGCFNASIARSRVKNGLYSNLDLGSVFTFRVVGLEAVNGVLSISGAIEDKNIGKGKSQNSAAKHQMENTSSTGSELVGSSYPKKSKKQKNIDSLDLEEISPIKKRKMPQTSGAKKEQASITGNEYNNSRKQAKISQRLSSDTVSVKVFHKKRK